MTATPQGREIVLGYCFDLARTLLQDMGTFFPFGAIITLEGKLEARGQWTGKESPNHQDLFKLLEKSLQTELREGKALLTALAVDVNIPPEYPSPYRDGVRVDLNGAGYSKFVYRPYRLVKGGWFRKTPKAEFAPQFEKNPNEL